MATWKASNVLGWGGVALASALALHTVADEAARRFHRFNLFSMNGRPLAFFITWQSVAPEYGYRAAIAIATGVLIGAIVGRKVLKAPAWTAAIVASVYVLISWFMLETSLRFIHPSGEVSDPTSMVGIPRRGLPSGAREWSYSLLALLVVGIAPLVARLLSRRPDRR